MSRKIRIEKEFLVLPAAGQMSTRRLFFRQDGEKVFELDLPVGKKDEIRFYAAIPAEKWKGRELSLEFEESTPETEELMECITQSDEYEQKDHSDALRPSIHFTPAYGWMNDPNGLLYKNGEYHMYFQYNPVNDIWGNMSWGHAVSKDLLHWKQEPPAILPGKDGAIFSGCAVDNREKVGALAENAWIFYYTCGGGASAWSRENKSPFSQKLAYSTDGGKSLLTYEAGGLPCEQDEDRDPKIYWHEESNAYYMVLYLSGSDFGIYRSKDLFCWEKTQELTFDGMMECPDLFPLETGQGRKWVFLSADGSYIVGDFDGFQFKPLQEKQSVYGTDLPYAGQTFVGTEEKILVKWLRTWNKDETYTGTMSVPTELGLTEKEGKYILTQKFTENFEMQKKIFMELESYQGDEIELRGMNGRGTAELEITWDIKNPDERALELLLGKEKLRYQAEEEQLVFTGDAGINEEKSMTVPKDTERLRILSDGPILEVLSGDGRVYGAFELNEKPEDVWKLRVRNRKMVRIYTVG
ncbi:MAG TPA: glycoside hydrolase family 32 protein [Candidatus Mediterraneibacter intestinavium]|nr:glycoside hydrolase family 32 protein [Candidatus Mediterraneibacter intestinavium]